MTTDELIKRWIFLSTPSGWRATTDTAYFHDYIYDFYPRPPGGGRPYRAIWAVRHRLDFYPRPPGGGRQQDRNISNVATDFYPRPPGGGRHGRQPDAGRRNAISIHALRVEGDLEGFYHVLQKL